jgi:hypothetical protein
MRQRYRYFFILSGFLILIFLFIISFSQKNEEEKQRERIDFVKQLDYEFCGTVIKKEELYQQWGYGYIYCRLDSNTLVNSSREDSLQNKLKFHDKIKFILVNSFSFQVKMRVPGISSHEVGDRICVVTRNNELMHVNQNKDTSFVKISNCLEHKP